MRNLVIKNQVAQRNNTSGMSQAEALGNAIANGINKANPSVYNLMKPGEPAYNVQPKPSTWNFTITSAAGTGAEAQTAFIFNEDIFFDNLTDNGSGAGSIVTTYGDGFSGNWYNAALSTYNQGVGQYIYGWTVQAFQLSSGNQDPTIYSTMNFTWAPYNGYGKPLSETQDFNQAISNQQFQDGIFTLAWEGFLSRIGQFNFIVPVDSKIVFTFLNKPIQRGI